jgi:hypothetical protein
MLRACFVSETAQVELKVDDCKVPACATSVQAPAVPTSVRHAAIVRQGRHTPPPFCLTRTHFDGHVG